MDSNEFCHIIVDHESAVLSNLAQICKGGWAQEAPKLWKFSQNCEILAFFCPAWTTQYTYLDEIKPVSVDHWPTISCLIWPRYGVAYAAGLQWLGDAYSFYRVMQCKAWYCYHMSSVHLSIHLSVCDIGGSWPHRSKILETNCTNN